MFYAHAFGARYELPLPLIGFVIGGAIVVLVSFLLVARRPGTAAEPAGAPVENAGAAPPGWIAGSVATLILAGLVVAGIGGSQELAENIVPTTFWVVLWIVVPLTCGLAGDWTRRLNPFRVIAGASDSARLRRVLTGSEDILAWRAGWWPAVAAYFVTACGELIYNQQATLPRVTAFALVACALITAVMSLLFGAPAWLTRGELFSVMYATWGRLGYWRFGAPGRRGFAGGLDDGFEPAVSRTVFVLCLLISVSFDGFLATPLWARAARGFNDVEITLAFLTLAIVTLAVFGAFARGSARLGGGAAPRPLHGLLPSLLPIAFGYLLAHNLQYVLINGQLLIPLAGDPGGRGWSLLFPPFTDDYEVHRSFLPSGFYWYAGVAIIVAVHVIAVVLAHRHLARTAPSGPAARRSEYPWLVAMVAYTMLSLWLLAQPLAAEKPAAPAQAAAVVAHR